MRVLVLGGTGAMGAPLIRLLNECGAEVYVTSRRKLESEGNIHFIQGDAHDLSFIRELLRGGYDAIVDFMVYSTEFFKKRSKLYLDATDQYLFVSSARVYANSKEPITEDSPRLLDVCKDEEYLKTDEYALAKARSEDVLLNSTHRNWTIIRPYITYSMKRLQLGGLEIESWASRIQRCKSEQREKKISGVYIVLPKDIAYKQTTMTHGEDVAKAFVGLIGNPKAIGETFHITGADHKRWIDVANIYSAVIQEFTGITPVLFMPENSFELSRFMGNYYQIKYDRMYDRFFDNSKLKDVLRINSKLCYSKKRTCGQLDFTTMNDGLRKCLGNYLTLYDQSRPLLNYRFEAYIDKEIYRTRTLGKDDFINYKTALKYWLDYYAPEVLLGLKKLKEVIIKR